MALGEIFLSTFLEVLLGRLASEENLQCFSRILGIDKEMQKLKVMLSAIQAVVNDAEEKQLSNLAVKMWLDDLRDLAHDVEDIVDEFSTEMLRLEIENQYGATTISKLWRPFSRVQFNFNMNSEIKEINDRLQVITERKDQLRLNEIGSSSAKAQQIPPSSCQLEGPVIGREKDKMKIVEFLSREEPCSTINYQVVAVVGMAGVGKTTLAGHVFNDNAVELFDLKVWVSVSDDFDLVRVTKAILESVATNPAMEFKEFNKVQEHLSKELAGKKFLIVLDDVWNTCGYNLWTKLQSPFRVGAQGSKILVTTRDGDVAKMMRATEVHNLNGISNDDCWKVFEQHAPLNLHNDMPAVSESLKEKIIAKCNGLPLAARALGGLLCCKEIYEWEEILSNKMWSLSDDSGILPVLKLSYHYIPSSLKRCFAYCSIFPNDYEFGEKQLVLLWMAEGLVQLEDTGSDCLQALLSRSLFQKSRKNSSKYVMHDLVADLARWAAGETCFRLEESWKNKMQLRCSLKARYSSYTLDRFDGVQKFEAYSDSKCPRLRTFLPLSLSDTVGLSYLAYRVTSDLLLKLHYLRVLSFKGYTVSELPDSVGKLKHLRYLDLSYTLISSLPDSTCVLYNLQTLILEGCSKLKALPPNMRNLISLRHLNNSGVHNLKEMPPQLGQLTNLHTLSEFVVGEGSGSGLKELGTLMHLQGALCLSRLENVLRVADATGANLKSKEHLEALSLEWSDSSGSAEIASDVLNKLQPHRKLKELTICGYDGLKFSPWIGSHVFSNMVLVKLEDCYNCDLLPPLGQLPRLKELHVRGLESVESVGPEFYGEGSLPFQALETLIFENMENWKEWSPCQQNLGIGVFSCLKMLSVKDCCKLEGRLPEKLDSLVKLEISGCEALVVSISNYKQLQESDIRDCRKVSHTSNVHFDSLESFQFSNISEFKLQPEGLLKGLSKVKVLRIGGCEELTWTFQNEQDGLLQHLNSLHRLYIEDNSSLVEELGKEAEELLPLQVTVCKLEYLELKRCGNLSKIPEGFHHLMSLQELCIYECPSLVSFPDIGLPPCLKVVEIEDCKSLLYFARYQIPPSLTRIHIRSCENLESLIENEEVVVDDCCLNLEFLEITDCPSLLSLSFKGQLPLTLKQLWIQWCAQLELIPDRFLNDKTYQLEELHIWECPNLKYLPEGLSHLTNLQSFAIFSCEKLKVVPSMLRDMIHNYNNLSSLQRLTIDDCEGLNYFLEAAAAQREGFPPNLTSLTIFKGCKGLLECERLHQLTSLRELSIEGGEESEMVSFPPAENEEEMPLLPKSLIQLSINNFPNLKKLSKGFQLLTLLEDLFISACPKLASIPDKGLPLSLKQLWISGCPLLEDRCSKGGPYWPKISHIPCVRIN